MVQSISKHDLSCCLDHHDKKLNRYNRFLVVQTRITTLPACYNGDKVLRWSMKFWYIYLQFFASSRSIRSITIHIPHTCLRRLRETSLVSRTESNPLDDMPESEINIRYPELSGSAGCWFMKITNVAGDDHAESRVLKYHPDHQAQVRKMPIDIMFQSFANELDVHVCQKLQVKKNHEELSAVNLTQMTTSNCPSPNHQSIAWSTWGYYQVEPGYHIGFEEGHLLSASTYFQSTWSQYPLCWGGSHDGRSCEDNLDGF